MNTVVENAPVTLPPTIEEVAQPVQIRASIPHNKGYAYKLDDFTNATMSTVASAGHNQHAQVQPNAGMRRGVSRVTAMLQKSAYEFKRPNLVQNNDPQVYHQEVAENIHAMHQEVPTNSIN